MIGSRPATAADRPNSGRTCVGSTGAVTLALAALVLAGCVAPQPTAGPRPGAVRATDLRCDWGTDPLGVDSAPPRLSWKLESRANGERQSAWQIRAASTREALRQDRADRWDSGRVAGDTQLHVPYAGRPPASSESVFWAVRVWDREGRPSAWSEPATWTMGILNAADWQGAQWITDPAMLPWVRAQAGFHSEETSNPDTKKWLQVDLGTAYPVDLVKLHALRYGVPERLGFPLRFKVELSDDPFFLSAFTVADFTAQDYPNPWATDIALPIARRSARYVRLTAVRLAQFHSIACLALSQIEVYAQARNVARQARVTASDSWERGPWSAAAVTDGAGVPGANPWANTTLLLRKVFPVRTGLRRAVASLCGLGTCVATINGLPAGSGLLSPGWTNTEKTCLYETLDLTDRLHPGPNALGLTLAGGLYNVQTGRYTKLVTPFRPLVAIAVVRLEYADGSVDFVATDPTWRVAGGPTTFAHFYGGEDFDARRIPAGWDRPGFDDHEWRPACVTPGPGGVLRGYSHASPPFQTYGALTPVAIRRIRPDVIVYDLGQNASLVPRLRITGSPGAAAKIRPAELLNPDGTIDRTSVGGGDASWKFTLAGRPGGESWMPQFFYHGCRYLQVDLSPGADGALPHIDSLVGIVVHSDCLSPGQFQCSSDLFNRIRILVRWAQLNNLAHVLTDCPHRERLGWLEQYHLNGPSLRYESDLTRLYAKTFADMAEAQTVDGLVPDIAPEFVIFSGGFRDSPEWGASVILAAWQHYVWTGDESLLRQNYGTMRRYLDYLSGQARDHLLNYGLGDWYDLGPRPPGTAQLTPIALTATAIYFECTTTLARIAERLGRPEDARRYSAQADLIKVAFNSAFLHSDASTYATGSQTALALPLVVGLVPPAARPAILDALVRAVRTAGDRITAGDVGYRYLLRALADAGRSDVVYAMNTRSDRPGYGYQLAQGATSLTEAWNAERTSSQDHFMLGQIDEWFFGDLVGITPDPAAPGFRNVLIRPQPVAGITWARATIPTPRGPVSCSWSKPRGLFRLELALPVGTTGTVRVPATTLDGVRLDSQPLIGRHPSLAARLEDGCAIFPIESGRHVVVSETVPVEN